MTVQHLLTSRGLDPDGIAGPSTWPELVVVVSQGSGDTNAVRAAQTQLNKYGGNLVVDGAFGPATRSAVQSFQASRGLSQTGTVDLPTWQELLGHSQTYDQTLCYSTGGNRNAQIITLMAAMQESRLCNIQFGDRDSLGLFQQRPSQGWCPGSVQRSCCPQAYAQWEPLATTLADTY